MNYRVYGNTYFNGYELVAVEKDFETAKITAYNLDAHIYSSYLIIEHDKSLNMDTPIDRGCLDSPTPIIKKRKK